ncbi:MAG: lamin tail domain-containing protein, partial [FCB group bacterium]|nr:lamin tail domain-containing protein [FCB group bacterium]
MKYIEIGLIVFGLLRGQIVITEVMYNLPGSDSPNEFVELFNLSFNDSVDLHGFTIRDRASTDALVDSGYGLMIAPRHYALILEGDYSFSDGLYSGLIPDSTLLIKVDDSSIGNGLSGTDSLYLADSTGWVADSIGWTDRADPGFSLEKIRYTLENTAGNWSPSRDSLGTPGRRNSVYPLEIDGSVLSESPLFRMDTLNPGEVVTETAILANMGFQPISGSIHIYVDSLETEVLPVGILEALDTLAVPVTLSLLTGGYHTVEIDWIVDGDLDTDNNRGRGIKGVRFQSEDILLNEFLAAPTGDQIEFVECISQSPLNLYRWAFTDNRPTHFSRIIQNVTVPSYQYFVLAADSSLISDVPDSAVLLTPVS